MLYRDVALHHPGAAGPEFFCNTGQNGAAECFLNNRSGKTP